MKGGLKSFDVKFVQQHGMVHCRLTVLDFIYLSGERVSTVRHAPLDTFQFNCFTALHDPASLARSASPSNS